MRRLMNSKSPSEAETSLRVLIADDDPIFRSVIAAKLARINAEIVEAADGGAAWQALEQGDFHLALVDLEMPNMKGVELIKRMRETPRTHDIPVVVMTSRNDSEAVRSSLDAGATSFMTKPINWAMFANQIDTLLRLHALAELGRRAEMRVREQARTHANALSELDEMLDQSARVLDGAVALVSAHMAKDGAPADIMQAVDLILHEAQSLRAHVERVRSELGVESQDEQSGALPNKAVKEKRDIA